MDIFSSNRSFGGWTKMFSHFSDSCNGIMRCSIYLPPQADTLQVPVLYWLSGLTCTHENFITKAGAQQFASELGLIIVAPDTDHIFTTSDVFEVSEALVVNSEEYIDVVEVVSEFSLSSYYPNTFNPTTTIDFSVAQTGYASVKVYNLMGQVVDVLMDGMVEANTYNLTWDAQHLASGVYMIKAQSNDQVATQKVMLLK